MYVESFNNVMWRHYYIHSKGTHLCTLYFDISGIRLVCRLSINRVCKDQQNKDKGGCELIYELPSKHTINTFVIITLQLKNKEIGTYNFLAHMIHVYR